MELIIDELDEEKVEEITQKKQVSYDDILSSLNMTVINGKLQIARNSVVENKKVGSNIQQQQQQYIQQQQPIIQQQHFMTKEQYQKNRTIQYIKHIEQQKRIAQIKSKKLMFSSSNGVRVIPNNSNNLGRLYF